MKIKDGFVLRKFTDEYVVVAVEDESYFNKLITLSSSGAFIFELLGNDITEEEIILQVINKYHISADTAKTDVREFLEDMKKAGLIDV